MRISNRIKTFFYSGLLFSSCLLSGCHQDPLDSLKSNSVNSGLSYQFWLQQYKQNTPLWHEAIKYCVPHEDKPNCKDVLGLYFFGDGHEKPPVIGQSGESIHLDT